MSTVIRGVYRQEGQADSLVPVLVDSSGKLVMSGGDGGSTQTSGLKVVPMPYFCGNSTAMLSVGTTSASITIPDQVGSSIRVTNIGSNVIWFKTGATGTTPTATISLAGVPGSTPVLPNTTESFSIPSGHSVFAAISNAAGNTVYVSSGEGI